MVACVNVWVGSLAADTIDNASLHQNRSKCIQQWNDTHWKIKWKELNNNDNWTLFSVNVSHKICLCLNIEFDTQFSCYFRLTLNEFRTTDSATNVAVNKKISNQNTTTKSYSVTKLAHKHIHRHKCISEVVVQKTLEW